MSDPASPVCQTDRMRLPIMLLVVYVPCWATAQSATISLDSDTGGTCVMTCGASNSIANIDVAELWAEMNQLKLEVAALKYLQPSPPSSPPPSPPPPPPSPPPAMWKLSSVGQSCTESCAESQLHPDLDVLRAFAITARNLDATQINAHLGLGDICSSNSNSGNKANVPWLDNGECRFYHDDDSSISEMNPNSRHSYASRLCYCSPVQWLQFSHWVSGSELPVMDQGLRTPALNEGNFLAQQSWALSCEAAEMIGLDSQSDSKVVMKVAMGTQTKGENHVVDYFRPRDGYSFCDMLKGSGLNSRHEWSPDGLTFYDPTVDCVSDEACGYYSNHMGGNAGFCTGSPSQSWLQTNIRAGTIAGVSPADDTRVFTAYWASAAGNIGSGCCYQDYTAGCGETTCQCEGAVWGFATDIYIKASADYKSYRSCKAALAAGETTSKVYMIHFGSALSYPVYCDQVTNGGGWSLLLTQIDATNDLSGSFPYTSTKSSQGSSSFTPFKKDLNALKPSLDAPYARDWTSSGPIGLLPSKGDGIMITRGGDSVSDSVTMIIDEWCGGASWEDYMNVGTACGSVSHDLPGFARGNVFDKDGSQITPTKTQRSDNMFNFHGCSHVGGCGINSPGDGAGFSTHNGWAEAEYNCYGGCYPATTNGANGAASHWNGEILVDGSGTRASEPLSYWFREAM